jgi:hypothetical protein
MKLKKTILLIEQDSKINVIRKSILEKLPLTINYQGPESEVMSGIRSNIKPVVLGKHVTTGNLIIWAYTEEGVSKKGLPNWKMFRVDRITNANIDPNAEPFKLGEINDYQAGKALKSLSSVLIYSDAIKDAYKAKYSTWQATQRDLQKTNLYKPGEKTRARFNKEIRKDIDSLLKKDFDDYQDTVPSNVPSLQDKNIVYGTLEPKLKDINGQKTLSTTDYDNAIKDLYSRKLGQWQTYQREVGNSSKPQERIVDKFNQQSKNEIDRLLQQNNVIVTNDISEPVEPEEYNTDNNEMLSEIRNRFKRLIN